MSENEFNGEKLTVTRTELALVVALALVVGSMFVGLEAFILLGVLLAVVLLAACAALAGGYLPGMRED